MFNFFENYLYNRKQSVIYNEIKSKKPKCINSGVPQGEVGFPEMFNVNETM